MDPSCACVGDGTASACGQTDCSRALRLFGEDAWLRCQGHSGGAQTLVYTEALSDSVTSSNLNLATVTFFLLLVPDTYCSSFHFVFLCLYVLGIFPVNIT